MPVDPPVALTADDDESASRCQGAAYVSDRGATEEVEDDVVVAGSVCEVLTGVVDDVIGAKRGRYGLATRPAYSGNLGAERLRDLHRNAADHPEAPTTSTRSPCWTRPWSRTACRAAKDAYRNTAASSKLSWEGLGATLVCGAATYSA